MRRKLGMLAVSVAGVLAFGCTRNTNTSQQQAEDRYSGWHTYAGSVDGNRYSSNTSINTANVAQLQVAWTYSTHDKNPDNRSQLQCNPIVVNGVLYGTSPKLKLFALDAATGKQRWLFDPYKVSGTDEDETPAMHVSRGVAYWQSEDRQQQRILYAVGPRLYAIDAGTGIPAKGFGQHGWIDLRQHLDLDFDASDAYAVGTTPGVVFKDLYITGMRLSEGADALPGHIRAFDVRTGARRWIFHTIPHPGEPGYDTWDNPESWRRIGGANSWAGMALDERRGIVYVPTGTASPDFYGGVRKGQNLYANSLIALDAATGGYKWHFQTVHHDLWDRDLAANPNLVTIQRAGKAVDAVAQITKHGYVFLFDRTNGKPIFPIVETPVPTAALPGEKAWPTQPIPTLPEPFARQHFGPELVTDLTPEKHAEMMAQYTKVQDHAMFTPPGKNGSWIFPGFDGGGEWGGAAVDVATGILYVNSSELPWSLTMVDVPKENSAAATQHPNGPVVYAKHCASCHGTALQGNGTAYPSLVSLGEKYGEKEVRGILDNGRNMMPSFRYIPEREKQALVNFLLQQPEDKAPELAASAASAKEPTGGKNPRQDVMDEVPYRMTGYNRFLDKDGYPGIKPPWGTLNAVDLNSGKLLWKVPLGEYEELTRQGIPPTGTENYGGPLVTQGGLVFIAATKDQKIRAFDKQTGKVLWEAKLPAAGYATPATYQLNGRQYVVIACGGGKIGSPSGDQYVAFALPAAK
ncbi:PQQ-binding-like beta-propeller repeat protein [Pontibacter sp. E15-1]|uniref:outer membrane protein assembly factor BamB family protein n=1 Tax=Pontibacter sp. E15-1 TaxID=2919918 RepID=UPI001F4FEE33|nr:PQQ-binding-like beta-propeller repeat protein [Pontibacter sp. E15-1]MCJ8165036.1 PQQ-binding-like beta-propeller repeat protein [Pontibacter sp. E15-1]